MKSQPLLFRSVHKIHLHDTFCQPWLAKIVKCRAA